MQKKNWILLFIGFIFVFFLALFFTISSNLFAQTVGQDGQVTITDTAFSISVADANAQDGDIICSDGEGYKLCKIAYNSSIFGVIVDNPSTAIQITDQANSRLVISRGEVVVRVSSINGNIKKGDSLTSSEIPGVAQLATDNGYVIGNALDDYTSDDTSATGRLTASLNIRPRTDVVNPKENLLDLFRSGLAGLSVSPIAALRYILASAMVLTSFVIGFVYFGRIAKTGVEAIGRNPLAGFRIQLSVILNIAIMVVTVLVGLAIAYLILAI